MPDKPTLTVNEAAKVLGVSEATMRNIIRQADFDAAIRVGPGKRSIRILTHRLLAWMDRQAQKEAS